MDAGSKSESDSERKTYSISLRLRRVTLEDAYVSVPVTDAIIEVKEDGSHRVNFNAFVAEGIRISNDPRTEWTVESVTKECHPIQQAPPEGRSSICPLFEEPIKH